MTKRIQIFMAVGACAGMLAVGGGAAGIAAATQPPASSSAALISSDGPVAHTATAAATAKFLLHAGIAYYVFDHYIWKPYKAGELHGFTHKLKIIEAGVAALVVYHEAKLMVSDVKGSRLLSVLAAPLTAVVAKLASLKSAISGGNLGAVQTMQGDLGSIKEQSKGKGVPIKEITHSIS